jgi:hypothetical protein
MLTCPALPMCVVCCAVPCCAMLSCFHFQDKDALRGHRHVSKERGLTSPRSDRRDRRDEQVGSHNC